LRIARVWCLILLPVVIVVYASLRAPDCAIAEAGQSAAYMPLVISQAGSQPIGPETPAPTPTAVAPIPAPQRGAYVGAFVDLYEASDSGYVSLERQAANYRDDSGKDLAIGLVYMDFGIPFQVSRIRRLAALEVVPMVTWDPVGVEHLDLQSILSGEWDGYIVRWAHDAASIDSPMFVSFGHEMNGDWYAHSGSLNGGGETTGYGDPHKPDGPERYVDTWRRVHGILKREGVTNVSWVFSPNCESLPNEAWNRPISYYPGAAYVDWVGIDGYNWGTTQPAWGSQWLAFDEVFDSEWRGRSLSTMMDQIPDKPFMIAEFASAEQGGDKAGWIADAYSRIQHDYPRIGAVLWFNQDRETDWRINSSESSRQAYENAVSDPYWIDHVPVW